MSFDPPHSPPGTSLPHISAPEIEHTAEQVIEQPKVPKGKSVPRWEVDTRERVKSSVKRMLKPLADLVARDANEGDTRLVVTDFLTDALGFDKYQDLTTEYQVRGEFADYGLRVDQQLVAFLETKRAVTKLNVKHLRQVEMYALNEGVEWVILTNGQHWQVYHVGVEAGSPVKVELTLDIDLLGSETVNQKAEGLFFLTKEAFKRKLIDDLWREKVATSPRSLAGAVLSDTVVEAVRKELRRRTGQHVTTGEIDKLLRETVIRPECLS